MIVIDASVAVDLLLRHDPEPIERVVFAAGSAWQAPHVIDLEVLSALRKLASRGEIQAVRANAALRDFTELPIDRHEHETLLARAWSLRHTHTAYDGAYVALAEALQAPLVTRDARLASSHGHAAKIIRV